MPWSHFLQLTWKMFLSLHFHRFKPDTCRIFRIEANIAAEKILKGNRRDDTTVYQNETSKAGGFRGPGTFYVPWFTFL